MKKQCVRLQLCATSYSVLHVLTYCPGSSGRIFALLSLGIRIDQRLLLCNNDPLLHNGFHTWLPGSKQLCGPHCRANRGQSVIPGFSLVRFTINLLIVVQLLSCVQLFMITWTAACQAPLSFTISWSLLKLMSIDLVILSNHFTLCHPLLHLPSVFPSIRVFSNESALCTRWPKYWSFSFSITFQLIFWVDFLKD